jgi:kynurenine formamidase
VKLIDLSHPFDPALFPPKHGAFAPLQIRPVRTIAEDGVNTRLIAFDNHIGTHIDAPLHLVAGGKSIGELPLESFYGTAVVLDIPKGPNGGVSAADLESATPRIETGDIVVIASGWSHKLTDSDYASHHPYLTNEGAAWLVAKRIRMVGMDVQSVDLPHSLREKGFSYTSLRTLLKHGIPALMNLTNLAPLVGRRVTLLALPINFVEAEGAPARVVALVD